MVPAPFYEPHWTDQKLIDKQLGQGKMLAGRLFFDPNQNPKVVGFVKPDPIVSDDGLDSLQLLPIKIWGIRHLNRCMHMDRVYVKFVNWVEWGKASHKTINNVDFGATYQYIDYVNNKLKLDVSYVAEHNPRENIYDMVPIEDAEPEENEDDDQDAIEMKLTIEGDKMMMTFQEDEDEIQAIVFQKN